MYNIFPRFLLSSMHYGGGERQTLTIKIGLNIYKAPQAMFQVNNGKHVTLLWSWRTKLGLSLIFFFFFFSLIECYRSSLLMCSLNVPWHLLFHSCLKELRMDYWLQAKKKKNEAFFQGTGKYSDPIMHTYNSHFLIHWILNSCVPFICSAFTLSFILLHLHLATTVPTMASCFGIPWRSCCECSWCSCSQNYANKMFMDLLRPPWFYHLVQRNEPGL